MWNMHILQHMHLLNQYHVDEPHSTNCYQYYRMFSQHYHPVVSIESVQFLLRRKDDYQIHDIDMEDGDAKQKYHS